MQKPSQKMLKGGFHGLVHVSKSKLFISILINAIALKTLLRFSSVISCYIVNLGRMTDDKNSQKISVDFTESVDR